MITSENAEIKTPKIVTLKHFWTFDIAFKKIPDGK